MSLKKPGEHNKAIVYLDSLRSIMCHLLNVLLALLSRFLFAVHGMVTVWHVVVVKEEPLYWLLLTGVALLGVEMAITLKFTQNAEWKW